MAELWLVCEGTPDSVDATVLQAVFQRVLPAGIVVAPACGASSLGSVAHFLQSQRGGRAACISDRDYRRREEAENSLRDGTNSFLWRRHSIENYLLPPAVLARALQRLREQAVRQFSSRLPPWATAIPVDSEAIAEALRECGRLRAAEEAVRLAVHRLWEDLSGTVGRIQKRIPTHPSGTPREDPATWRDGLRQEAERLRRAASEATASPLLEVDALLARFDSHYTTVSAGPYIADLQFLVDFHGRELLQEFRDWLGRQGVRISYDRLVQSLIEVVSDVYAANRALYGTDDFLDLANGVRALAGLTPLA